MSDFEVGAELSLGVSRTSLRNVRAEIESELSDIPVGVEADLGPQARTDGGTGGREQRRRRREFRWSRERTEYLEQTVDLLESIEGDMGEGGGGGLLSGAAKVAGGVGLGIGGTALAGLGGVAGAVGGGAAVGQGIGSFLGSDWAQQGAQDFLGVDPGPPEAQRERSPFERTVDDLPEPPEWPKFPDPPQFPEFPDPPEFPDFPEVPTAGDFFGSPIDFSPDDIPFGDPIDFSPDDFLIDKVDIGASDLFEPFSLEEVVKDAIEINPEFAFNVAMGAVELSAEIDSLQNEVENEVDNQLSGLERRLERALGVGLP